MLSENTITLPFQRAATGSATSRQNQAGSERYRVLIVRLIFAAYWLLILEGALRKWVLPSFGKELFFIRDPFILLIYSMAITGKLWPKSPPPLVFGAGFSILVIPLAIVQIASGYIAWPLTVYGWRCYFLYLPLPFIIAKCFNRADLDRLIRYTLLLSIPMALLVSAQRKAPSSAPINAGIVEEGGTEYNKGFVIANGIVRTSGTFTSPLGLECYSETLVAMVLGVWLMEKKRRPVKGLMLVLTTFSSLICVALNGNRGTLLTSGIILLGTFAATAIVGRSRIFVRLLVASLIVVIGGAIIIPAVFPDQYDAIATRWTNGSNTGEGDRDETLIFKRMLFQFFGFVSLLPETPMAGVGIGNAGNGGQGMDDTAYARSEGAETGWGRHIEDLGPVLGVMFILFRVGLTCWIGGKVFRASRSSCDPLSFILFAYDTTPLLVGLLTAQGTVNGYGWMFAGFALAAASCADRRVARPNLSTARPMRRLRPPTLSPSQEPA